jgi:phospholipid/cholesterol/gamma-HCH transport system ATP-binding protein
MKESELLTPTYMQTALKQIAPVIEITGLSKYFGNQTVLNGINMQLEQGENLVVLGKSGSGKSVLIKCIAALITPDAGKISVLGQDVLALEREALAELRKQIGFMFQNGALYDSMTVRENLEFPLRRIKKDMDNKALLIKVEETLEQVGLKDTLNKMPSQLSGGMRKRISLARTIVLDPLIMLYDEPTAGLDPVTSDEISNLILDVQKTNKTSSVIITHDIACAKTIADRMVMLKDGKIYLEGNTAAILKSTDPEIKAFFK